MQRTKSALAEEANVKNVEKWLKHFFFLVESRRRILVPELLKHLAAVKHTYAALQPPEKINLGLVCRNICIFESRLYNLVYSVMNLSLPFPFGF